MSVPPSFQIGVVAARTGLSVDAIRFYEKLRLVKTPVRSTARYRLFRQEDIDHFQFIRNAQTLGLSLEEIRELLSLQAGGARPCAEVERVLEKRLGSIRAKLAGLRIIENQLRTALRECRLALRRQRQPVNCPALQRIVMGPRSRRKT